MLELFVVSDQGLGRAGSSATVPDTRDRLLGGLLPPDFDDGSCLSRYRASLYRRPSLHVLSPHLVSRLRRYESLHRRCGPGTSSYSRAVARLRDSMDEHAPAPGPASSNSTSEADPAAECSYIVWTPQAGLGNRIISTAAAFLYALLTDRVLLVQHPGHDLDDIFCEPFPGSSTWVLPEKDFPIRSMERFNTRTRESLGNALRRGEGSRDPPAPWMYLHLQNNYQPNDRRFFCDDGQDAVRGVRWLVLRSDNYFVPGLFLVPRYERELDRLFPRRDAVFHHLGRYLFHPSNTVWAMVARYHTSYLAPAEERVGLQVRDFKFTPISADEPYSQIIWCAYGEGILPAVDNRVSSAAAAPDHQETTTKRKAVLVVSLRGDYYEKLSSMYYEHGAAGGGAVSVFQPTHLGAQHSEERHHNQKAFAEMVLLSFSDVVITSAASTFGYVSQGLAGLRPWVLMTPVNGKGPEPPCRLAPTIEPCFHNAPHYDCKTRARADSGNLVRHVRHCEDYPNGVQLVD
jgi:xyloglucan fucosyltransferase